MILKNTDEKNVQINQLRKLLKQSSSGPQQKLIKKELSKIEKGYQGEKEAEYFIDFHLKDSQNYYVLHDLRFEIDEMSAQIDHLIFHVAFGFILVETKNTSATVTINNDFSLAYNYNGKIKTLQNPMEQSKRHEIVLKRILKSIGKEHFNVFSCVVFMSKVNITNETLPNHFYRADSFVTYLQDNLRKSPQLVLKTLFKVFTNNITTQQEALTLLDHLKVLHKPLTMDYSKKFHMKKQTQEIILEPKIDPVNEDLQSILIACKNNNIDLTNFKDIKLDGKYMGNDMVSYTCKNCNTTKRVGYKKFTTTQQVCECTNFSASDASFYKFSK